MLREGMRKPCGTPLCEGEVVTARECRRCYERRRWADPERKRAARGYARRPGAREAHRLACRDYREAGKVKRGICEVCGGGTSEERARRCLRCFRERVLPGARVRGLEAMRRK